MKPTLLGPMFYQWFLIQSMHLFLKEVVEFMEGQNPKTCFPIKRKAGDTNIDLWLDGSIYSMDPSIGMPPPFMTLKAFLNLYVMDKHAY